MSQVPPDMTLVEPSPGGFGGFHLSMILVPVPALAGCGLQGLQGFGVGWQTFAGVDAGFGWQTFGGAPGTGMYIGGE